MPKNRKKSKSSAPRDRLMEGYEDPSVDPTEPDNADFSIHALKAAETLLTISILRSRVKLDDLAIQCDLGGRKSARRVLSALNQAWQKTYEEDLYKIVTESGNLWVQGSTSEQYLERVSKNAIDAARLSDIHRSLVSVIAMPRMVGVKGDNVLTDAYSKLTDGIKKVIGQGKSQLMKDAVRKFYSKTKGSIDTAKYQAILDPIYQGLTENRKLEIELIKDELGIGSRLVLPLTLIAYNGSLYLALVHDSDTQSPPRIYTYEVTKLRRVTLTQEKFGYPADYDPDKYFGPRFGLFDSKGSPQTVRLKINSGSPAHHHLTERTWGPNQTLSPQPDGSTIVEFTANNLTEVVPFILGYQTDVEALAPQALRDKIKQVVGTLVGYYK